MSRTNVNRDVLHYQAEYLLHCAGHDSAVPDAQSFVDHVTGTAWFQRRWPKVRSVEVRMSRDKRWATADGRVIRLPSWALGELTILHELAHCCVGEVKGDWHSERFARAEVDLVRRFMGPDAARCLRHALIALELLS